MKRHLTPIDIEILLHIHCRPEPYDNRFSPASSAVIERFAQDGLIKPTGSDDVWTTTERGTAYVVALCSTPPPFRKYVCGLTGEVIEDNA